MEVMCDEIYLNLEGSLHRVNLLTISGQLQWGKKKREPEYFILESAIDHQIFAGAAIADYGENDGRMFAMTFPQNGREHGIHCFTIPKKQKNMLRNISEPRRLRDDK